MSIDNIMSFLFVSPVQFLVSSYKRKQLNCTRCNKYFSYVRTLKRHLITCGSECKKYIICGGKCPDLQCNESLTNKKALHLHLEADHGMQLQKEEKTFATIHGECD